MLHPDVGSLDILFQNFPSSPSSKEVGDATISDTTKLVQRSTAAGFDLASLSPSSTPTSSSIIVMIHLLFLYQWNNRKRPCKVSYRVIVQKREYHKIWLATLSHPPANNHRRRSHLQHSRSPGEETRSAGGGIDEQQDIRRQLITQAHLLSSWAYETGFALLLYNSHIIWSCRSLEALYTISQGKDLDAFPQAPMNDANANIQPNQYVRVLFALTGIALVLEFRFSFNLLSISRKLEGSHSPATTFPLGSHRHNASHNRIQQKILHHQVGTLTALCAALVVVFHHHFEYVPLQVIPFVDNKVLLLGFSMPAQLTAVACWGILGYLSHPSHPVTPVLCGLASGSIWVIGLTSFLQEIYWGNTIIAAFILVSCLSIRASSNTNMDDDTPRGFTPQVTRTYIPCVDFVSPSYSGTVDLEDGDRSTAAETTFIEDNESVDDEGSYESSFSNSLGTSRMDEYREEVDGASFDLEMAPFLDVERPRTVRARRGVSIG